MARKPAADSIQGKILLAQAEQTEYEIPEGLEPLTNREQSAWNQYTRARTDWKESEFRTLHRIVKVETSLQKLVDEAAITPALYTKQNGDLAPHPIHGELRNQQKLLHAELKIVGLQVDRGRAGEVGRDGVKAKTAGRGKKPAGISLVG